MTERLTWILKALVLPSVLVLQLQNHGALAGVLSSRQQVALGSNNEVETAVPDLVKNRTDASPVFSTLDALLEAMDVMQTKYFDITTGTWPSSIDWTAAVMGTHISSTLSTLVTSIDSNPTSATCAETIAWDNLISRYFSHTSIFYFGENALALRQQAYDDMLWVVLGWLENIKFIDQYSSIRSKQQGGPDILEEQAWHGTQFKASGAHRARVFYDLASHGWDTSLCGGGMVWNQHLRPYKNAITNELFISASVSMYLYFPGDDNDSPFISGDSKPGSRSPSLPHNSTHLQNAIKAYDWLHSSNMTSPHYPGLYADGFHISDWQRTPSGDIDPGTGKCDDLNTMLYTYNQGVVLTGLRGLWLATGESRYLADGHELIEAVVTATGWANDSDGNSWAGFGRGGVLEEYCDSHGGCNQDGQTFKGIFFHHLAEFCRPLSEMEEDFVSDPDFIANRVENLRTGHEDGFDRQTWEYHLYRCEGYKDWVQHNAHAAAVTRDEEGRFGMWWGRAYPANIKNEESDHNISPPPLPPGAYDHASIENMTQSDNYPRSRKDVNDRGRGRTLETQSGGLSVLRALWQWEGVVVKKGQIERQDQDRQHEL